MILGRVESDTWIEMNTTPFSSLPAYSRPNTSGFSDFLPPKNVKPLSSTYERSAGVDGSA